MRYDEWDPEKHTVRDYPLQGMTYMWRECTRGKGSARVPAITVGEDLLAAIKAAMCADKFMLYPADGTTRIKTSVLTSTGLPGWDYEFIYDAAPQ